MTNLNSVGSLYIKVTENCNMKCPFCYVNQKQNIVDVQSIVDIINKLQPNEIIFHGGEPLLYHDHILKIISMCSQDIVISITSNLTLPLTKERMQVLNKCNVSSSYSIDRFETEELLNKFKENFKTISKIKPITLLVTLSEKQLLQNVDDLMSVINYLGASNITIERMFSSEKTEEFYEKTDEYILNIFKSNMIPHENNNLRKWMVEAIENNTTVFPCECDKHTKTISPDNKITGCPNGEYKHKRKKICLTCDIYQYCRNDCPTLGSTEVCTFPKESFKYIYSTKEKC